MEHSSAFSADRQSLDSSAIRTPESGPATLHSDASSDTYDSLAVLRAALASSLSGVAVCDRFRRILLTNTVLDALFGYATGELLRRDIATIAPDATFGSATIRELDGVRKDGTTIPVKISITPATAHEPLFIVSVLDISDRRRVEAKHAALSHLAMRCAAADIAQLCDTLDQDLRGVADALGIDRCAAYLPNDDGSSISLLWRWERRATANLPDDFDAAQALPWTMNRTRDGEVVCVAAIDEVPNMLDRESMRNLGAVSYAAVPLTVSGVRATLIVDTALARTWPEPVVEDIRLLASVISQVFTRLEGPRSADGRDEPGRPMLPSRHDGPVLRREVGAHTNQMIVAESFVIRSVLEQVHQVAPTTATVLLLGETGVGKEVFAQTIHNLSSRQRRPMIRISCAAIPSALIESELFGRERGAFTGALSRQIGRFEAAHGSTIFLDEIGDLPLEIQVKLLRVLQERTVERLGGNQSVKVDVRVIAATNRNLEEAVANGAFREDLFYRLNVFPITIPPLRDRIEDIPSLAWSFIDEFSTMFGKTIDSLSKESLAALQRYSWPGNVRELRNVIEREMIVATGPTLTLSAPRPVASQRRTASSKLIDVEVEHIRSVLDSCRWRVRGSGGAAERLGVKPTTLESRMARLGIARDRPSI